MVTIMTVVPAIVTIIEFVRILRYIREICNCKKDKRELKDSWESDSVTEKSNESVDFLKDENRSEDSLVEKTITLSDSEEDNKS
jgi:hypothetical protein